MSESRFKKPYTVVTASGLVPVMAHDLTDAHAQVDGPVLATLEGVQVPIEQQIEYSPEAARSYGLQLLVDNGMKMPAQLWINLMINSFTGLNSSRSHDIALAMTDEGDLVSVEGFFDTVELTAAGQAELARLNAGIEAQGPSLGF